MTHPDPSDVREPDPASEPGPDAPAQTRHLTADALAGWTLAQLQTHLVRLTALHEPGQYDGPPSPVDGMPTINPDRWLADRDAIRTAIKRRYGWPDDDEPWPTA